MTVFYEVRKHFKIDGFHDYETLLKTDNKEQAENFLKTLPKDNKKVQYTCKGYKTVIITEKQKKDYQKIHDKIWANMTDTDLSSIF